MIHASVHSEIRHPLFAAHPRLEQALMGEAHVKYPVAGQHVFSHGDPASALWLVQRGWVKLTRQTPDGKETLVSLCTQGDLFGEAALFADTRYPYTAEIVGSDAELVVIPASVIRRKIAQQPELSQAILQLLSERINQAQLKLEQMNTMTAAQRLGCFFLRLCRSGCGAKTLTIPIEKHVLAAHLGMKPETFSRSQQQLRPQGITVNGATVTIKSTEQLRQYVCRSCSESGDCATERSVAGT